MDNTKMTIEIQEGKQKKDPSKKWRAVKVEIGSWSTLIFPKSNFEMDYIEKVIQANQK